MIETLLFSFLVAIWQEQTSFSNIRRSSLSRKEKQRWESGTTIFHLRKSYFSSSTADVSAINKSFQYFIRSINISEVAWRVSETKSEVSLEHPLLYSLNNFVDFQLAVYTIIYGTNFTEGIYDKIYGVYITFAIYMFVLC